MTRDYDPPLTLSTIRDVVHAVLADSKPVCRTCSERPRVRLEWDQTGAWMRATCHGRVEVRILALPTQDYAGTIDDIRAPWFLPNWAAFGKMGGRPTAMARCVQRRMMR